MTTQLSTDCLSLTDLANVYSHAAAAATLADKRGSADADDLADAARAAEDRLLLAMRRRRVRAVQVDGRVYVDIWSGQFGRDLAWGTGVAIVTV